MGKQNDKAPENNKPKKTAYLVCDGAMCMCDSGAKPAKLKVTKNKKVYINEESKKLLATEMDWTFDPPSVPFGSCKNKPGQDKSCTPAFVKWDKPYDSISADGHKVITDKSELVCKAFQGKVTVLKHGQVQQVSAGQIANLNQVVASQVNPFAPPPKRTEPDYNVSVTGIEAEIPETESSKSLSGKKREKVLSKKKPANPKAPADTHPVNSILARPGEEVLFTAASKAGGSEALISWKVTNTSGGEPFYYLQEGKEFRTFFHDEGKYRVEAYGTGKDGRLDTEFDSDSCNVRKEYDDCSLFVEVKPNEIAQLKLSGDKSNIIPGSISQPDSVRAGIPVKIEAVFLHPPIKEDADKLILIVQDAEGNELGRVEGKHEFLFTPANTGAKYLAEARYTTAETEVKKTLEFKTISNAVSVIGGTITEGTMARPGTEIIFNVEKTTFSGEVKDFEGEQIKWKLAGSNEVLGRGTEFKKTFDREGDYIVEAYVNSSNAVMALFRGKGEADDWRFTITRNYPTGITISGKPRLGRKIQLLADTIFPLLNEEKDVWEWEISGATHQKVKGGQLLNLPLFTTGLYKIKATLNGRSKETSLVCTKCAIVGGCWTDGDGNFLSGADLETSHTINFTGWGQTVCATFKHIGLAGERVIIKVWDRDLVSEDDPLVFREVTIPEGSSTVGYTFSLDEKVKEKATVGMVEGRDAYLYFTVEAADTQLKVQNNRIKLPGGEGHYLKVDGIARCKAYFSDNNDTRRYSVASQNTAVHAQLRTTNLQDKELLVEVWENIDWGIDKLQISSDPKKPDKYGMLNISLKLKEIQLKDNAETKQLFLRIKDKETLREYYNSNNIFMLTLYKELKTEPVSKSTTKALVVVDVSASVTGSCGGLSCLKVGSKSEIVREINIRLSGFGGNVPTDLFTARTENSIRRFQRDYMKVPETGRICGSTLKAIDEFCVKWEEKISDYICLCHQESSISNKCDGFGKGRYEGEYKTQPHLEKNYKYERPGIHRSLLWGTSALKFYLSTQSEYKFQNISAGYRCWDHNILKNRTSTNHMGKAIDITFLKNGEAVVNNLPVLRELRDKFYIEYLDAKYNWEGGKNNFSLEPIGFGSGETYSWMHMDVREFDSEFLEDIYFVKTQKDIAGNSVLTIAQEEGLTKLCNCKGEIKGDNKVNSKDPKALDCSTCIILDKTRKSFYEDFGEAAINALVTNSAVNKYKGLFIIAQRRQENGFNSPPGNNPMNIKGKGDLGVLSQNTTEYLNGKKVTMADNFANFSTLQKGLEGYLDLLKSNYNYAFDSLIDDSSDMEDFLTGLQKKGKLGVYATDPDYTENVKKIFYGVVKDYKKWLDCKLKCEIYSENIDKIKKDIALLNKLK